MTMIDIILIIFESSLKHVDRKSDTVSEFKISDCRLFGCAKNTQFIIENTLETAFQAALRPVEYASPGKPAVINPLLSDAFSLIEITHGFNCLPPKKYAEDPSELYLPDHRPIPSSISK